MEQQKVTGYWLPLNLDNSHHECDRHKKNRADSSDLSVKSGSTDKKMVTVDNLVIKLEKEPNSSPQLKNILEAQVFLEGIDARLKRVEKILFNERK